MPGTNYGTNYLQCLAPITSEIHIEQARDQINHFLQYGHWISDEDWKQKVAR